MVLADFGTNAPNPHWYPKALNSDDAVREETDLIDGVQDIPSAAVRAHFLSGEAGDTLEGAVFTSEVDGERTIRVGEIPFGPGRIIQVFISRRAIIAVVHRSPEVKNDRALHRFEILVNRHGEVERLVRRGLRKSYACDQRYDREKNEKFSHPDFPFFQCRLCDRFPSPCLFAFQRKDGLETRTSLFVTRFPASFSKTQSI